MSNGGEAMIKDALCVPEMKCNLISIGQLVEKGFCCGGKATSKELVLFLPGDIYRLGYIVSCPQRLVIDSSFDNSTINEFGIKRNENKRQKVNELKSIKDRQLVRNECKLPVTYLNLPPMSY